MAHASGMIVRPTVFHPRYFLTSEFFACFIWGEGPSAALRRGR